MESKAHASVLRIVGQIPPHLSPRERMEFALAKLEKERDNLKRQTDIIDAQIRFLGGLLRKEVKPADVN